MNHFFLGKVVNSFAITITSFATTASFKTLDGTTWRPSILEVQRGFIAYALV